MSIKIISEVIESATVRGSAYVVFLMLAEAADSETRSCYPGIKRLASNCRISKRSVQAALRNLEVAGIIETRPQSSHLGTNLYVISEAATWQTGVQDLHGGVQNLHGGGAKYDKDGVRDLHPNQKDINQDLNLICPAVPAVPKKRASRLDENWVLPDEWGQYALTDGWDEIAVRAEADKFRDFWISKAGKDAIKLDWFATWRNWLRSPYNQKNKNGEMKNDRPSKEALRVQAFIDGARQAAER